ncbi:hypothetical protein [Uliginosibacterium sp. H1]|uniref:hypothetical protein n=1 Tax=Uliginosibacterium sp. H1 TaxID=3114757 RepID=UPI002E19B6C5|nr:hypothetical protein [Uliginosibacterium sp. H1]
MMIGGKPDDGFDPALLSKADALIRRNRPDGVSSDAEELPMLTEAVDDLPELNDEVAVAVAPVAAPVRLTSTQRSDIPVLTEPTVAPVVSHGEPSVMDLESDEVEDIDLPTSDSARAPVVIGISHDQVEVLIREAMAQARQEVLQEHDQVVQDAVERARAEARLLQARAVQAAIEQGREEALASQTDYLRAVHAEAVQNAVAQMSEQLIELDAFISQSMEDWVSRELPQIIDKQFDSMVERVRAETTAHMRATLLPEISEKLSSLLDKTRPGVR